MELGLELIDEGDYAHAAFHLTEPAVRTPHEPRLQAAVARLCREVDEPLGLMELPESPYLGMVVLRGMIAAHCGRLSEALDLLLRAEGFTADAGYLDLWSVAPASAAALAAIDADLVGGRLARLVLDSDKLDEPQRSATQGRAASVLDTLLSHHPRSEPLAFAAVGLFRRVKRERDAVELARAFLAHTPSYLLQVGLAHALRELRQYDDAAQAYRAAQALQPEETAVSVDLGDMCGSIGRFEDAVASYRYALDREPQQPWVLASWHYYRWLLSSEPADADALARLAQEADNTRARWLLQQMRPYDEWLPGRPESLLKAIGQAPRGARLTRCTISSLEAPSALAVTRVLFPELAIAMLETEGVDPRVPRRKVKRVLWRYRTRGIWPLRALTDVADAVQDGRRPQVSAAISELAGTEYSAAGWYRDGATLAAQLGAGAIDAVCAAMVELSAAPALAHMPDGEALLWDLVYGPADWVSSAAIVALSQRAIAHEARRTAIADELLAQIDALENPIGFMCISLPAALNLMRIPGISGEAQRRARDLRRRDMQP